jgi:hypothetical protein
MHLEVDPADAVMNAGQAARCANCQAPLAGKFCRACGQRAHLHRSLLHLGEEALHGILHLDAKAWRTLPMLVARPGQLTRRYVDGQRTRFVSPLALFLFMIFLMFFVVSLVTHDGEAADPARDATTQAMAKVRSKLDQAFEKRLAEAAALTEREEARKGAREMRGIWSLYDGTAGYPDPKTSVSALDAAIKHALANPELTIYKLKNSASQFSFLLVPISLPFLWLMFFRRRGVTMYDHAVFVLYSLSFMALLVVMLALLGMAGMKATAWTLLCLIPPIHMFMQLRGTYALGVFSSLWRTAALLFVASIVFVLYLLLILVLGVR